MWSYKQKTGCKYCRKDKETIAYIISLLISFARWHLIVPLVFIFDTILCISQRFDAWIHNHKKQRRHKRQIQHQNILVWHLGSSVKPTQDLEWTENVRMVVWVTLNTKWNRWTHRVPGMHVSNWFGYPVFVNFSTKPVMLQIVYYFVSENSFDRVYQLEFNASESK